MNEIDGLVTVLMVAAVPLNWLVTILLWRLAKKSPELKVLRDRAIAATCISLAVTVFALIFINNDLALGLVDNPTSKVVGRLSVLVLSLAPALWWLRIYRSNLP